MRSIAAAAAVWTLATGTCAFADPPSMPIVAAEQLRGDLDIIWSAVEQGDPAFDRYRSRRELQHIFADARERIDRPMTELEFFRIAAPAVAALGNGHAQLALSDPVGKWVRQSAPLLPLGLRVLDHKLYVLRDFSGERTIPVGAQILSVNGVAVADLIQSTVRALSLDGMGRAPRENNAGGWQFLQDLVRLHDFGPSYAVTYEANGVRSTVQLAGRSGSDIVDAWRSQFPNDPEAVKGRGDSSLRFEGDLAILRIAHWDYPVEGQPGMSEKFQDWFRQIAQAHPSALVIDIRNNGGGYEPLASELLAHFVRAPFRYYKCLTMNATDFDFFRYVANANDMRKEIPSYVRPASAECRQYGALEIKADAFPALGLQQPRQPHFDGRLYLLVNSGSFSTSSEFSSVFSALHVGTIIGQETSGGYLGDSSGFEAPVLLPASGITFNSTLIAYHMAVPRHGGVQGGVVPDVIVHPRFEDLLAGRDLEMDEVRIRERRLH